MSLEIEALELKIAKFLRFGVLLSGALMLSGWIGLVLSKDTGMTGSTNPFAVFGHYQELALSTQLSEHFGLHPVAYGLCYGGLVCLISLPLIRVLLTAVLFFKSKDWILGCVAIAVLAGLLLSFMLGGLEGA